MTTRSSAMVVARSARGRNSSRMATQSIPWEVGVEVGLVYQTPGSVKLPIAKLSLGESCAAATLTKARRNADRRHLFAFMFFIAPKKDLFDVLAKRPGDSKRQAERGLVLLVLD